MEKKKIGCFGVFIIVLIVLAVLAGTVYLFLPKIISSAISGGAASSLLPVDAKRGINELNQLLNENIQELDKLGISPEEASGIVSSLEYDTFEKLINSLDKSPVSNSAELIDLVSKYVDLSSVDLNRIKDEYDFEVSRESIESFTGSFKENPAFMKTGFNVMKTSLLDILENAEK